MIEDANRATSSLEPKLAGYTGYLLRLAFVRIQEHCMAAMPSGRHPRELAVLTLLLEKGALSQARVCELLDINRTNMVKVVDNLEAAGFVQRERDPADRRRYALRVTDAGIAAREELQRAIEASEDLVFAPLTIDQRVRFNMLLRGLVQPGLLDTLPETITARTGFLVDRSHHRLRERAERRMALVGLTARSFGILTALESAEPCSQQRLADCMGVTGPAVVQIIDDLERAGVLLRVRNPANRREHVLRLTPAGREQLAGARGVMDGIQRELTGVLGEEEITDLNALLVRLAEK